MRKDAKKSIKKQFFKEKCRLGKISNFFLGIISIQKKFHKTQIFGLKILLGNIRKHFHSKNSVTFLFVLKQFEIGFELINRIFVVFT